jgi:phosphatidate cytidylyltransferase
MTRVISGAILALAALAAILFLPVFALRVVSCIVAALGAHEYARIAGTTRGVSELLVIVAAIAMCWLTPMPIAAQLRLLLLVLALAWVALEVLFLGRGVQQAGASLVAPIYIGVPLGMLIAIQIVGGWRATLLLIATVVVSDSAQYYTGRAFGRHHLAPTISPKKTVEGAIGGLVLGTAFMAIVGSFAFPAVRRASLIPVGVAVVVSGICGDLFESRLKRQAGVKDSSSLIPGHGGVLDRIDALLFATPAFYIYFTS